MTKEQLRAWYAVLGSFPEAIVNRAVIEIVLTEVRFPEVGDLYQICRRSLPRPYAPHGDGCDQQRPSRLEIATVAERLGMQI